MVDLTVKRKKLKEDKKQIANLAVKRKKSTI